MGIREATVIIIMASVAAIAGFPSKTDQGTQEPPAAPNPPIVTDPDAPGYDELLIFSTGQVAPEMAALATYLDMPAIYLPRPERLSGDWHVIGVAPLGKGCVALFSTNGAQPPWTYSATTIGRYDIGSGLWYVINKTSAEIKGFEDSLRSQCSTPIPSES